MSHLGQEVGEGQSGHHGVHIAGLIPQNHVEPWFSLIHVCLTFNKSRFITSFTLITLNQYCVCDVSVFFYYTLNLKTL